VKKDTHRRLTEAELQKIRQRFPAARGRCPAMKGEAWCRRPAGHVGFHRWKPRYGTKDKIG